MIVVIDASPLIAMSKIGLLNIFKDYFKEVYIYCNKIPLDFSHHFNFSIFSIEF